MVAEDERVAEEEHSLEVLSPCTVLEFQEQTKVSQKGPFDLLDDPDMFPEGGWAAYLVVLGSFFGFYGLLAFTNASGVLQNYIKDHILTGYDSSTIGWIFSINSFVGFGGTLVLGPIFDRIGAKIPIAVGIVFTMVGLMCMSVSTTIYQFILSYGIASGIGLALTFGPFVGSISHWFLRKRGQAIGIGYIGGAVGGLTLPVLFRLLLPKLGFGWSIRIAAFICLFALVVGFLLVRDRRHILHPGQTHSSIGDLTMQIIRSIDFTAFRQKIYTCLVLALLGNGFAFLVTQTYLPLYAVFHGYNESQAYLLLVVFNSLSIPGRVLPGWMADRYGRFNTLCLISSLSTIMHFVIWLPPPFSKHIAALYVFAAIYGFTSGSILSLGPACIGQTCETKDFGKRSGTAFAILSLGDLFGVPIGGAIVGKSPPPWLRNYEYLVLFVALCSFMGTLGALTARYLYAGIKKIVV
ncbi:hypothetical protein QFC19_007495 [Naganishia cerealis]|uniref:Uncharacterized protein n=1 Tax=Naganishia cerealis TaxID=610337 RepID=A0ACC2V816_9TREE|nr:hypothetical protein QFC19_007495 [Naganishia cerealis]